MAVAPDLQFRHLRSTWGTFACEATGDIRFAQAGLGHADSKVTERHYAAIRARHMVAQADRIRFGIAAPPSPLQATAKNSPATHPALTGAPETASPPIPEGATGPMVPKVCDLWACRDSNAGPLASEANALSN